MSLYIFHFRSFEMSVVKRLTMFRMQEIENQNPLASKENNFFEVVMIK